MGKLEKYLSYKDSGVEWLGEIPDSWEVKKLKFIVKEYGGNGFPVTEQGKNNGNIPFYKVSDINGSDTFIEKSNNYVSESTVKKMKWNLIPVNSIVTAKIGEALRKNHRKITKISSIIDNNCIAFEPIRINMKFNFYLHKIIDFDWFSNVGAVPSISVPQYKNFKIALPPKKEQTKIASFLDEKTEQLDKAISQKEKLIELLKERKQIVINEAVTKGLNKDVELVDSSVEWIGEIPKHWEISKLGTSLKPISIKNRADLPLLSVTRELGVILRDVDNKDSNHNFIPDDLSGYKMVEKGQFAMNKMKAWQGSYGISDYTGIVSPAYYIFELNGIIPSFFHKAIRCSIYVPFFIKASDGVRIGQWDLSKSRMKEIPFYIPPKEEQLQTVEYIENQTTKIDTAIELQQNYIQKLKEYKATLIDNVVTGKVRIV